MACVVVSAVAAIGASTIKGIVKHNENKNIEKGDELKVNWSTKLQYLEIALWSGTLVLTGEHILHGEITPYPPFLTGAATPESTATMLYEMGTVGIAMTLGVIALWAISVLVFDLVRRFKKNKKNKTVENK